MSNGCKMMACIDYKGGRCMSMQSVCKYNQPDEIHTENTVAILHNSKLAVQEAEK
jgi:hypothetical protein